MNVAKWLLLSVLALPLAELAVFIAVAAAIGFALALGLVLAGSLAGALVLRHAGGNHIARMRVALGDGGFTALQADSAGGIVLLAGNVLRGPALVLQVDATTVVPPGWRGVVDAWGNLVLERE